MIESNGKSFYEKTSDSKNSSGIAQQSIDFVSSLFPPDAPLLPSEVALNSDSPKKKY